MHISSPVGSREVFVLYVYILRKHIELNTHFPYSALTKGVKKVNRACESQCLGFHVLCEQLVALLDCFGFSS